MKRIVVGILRIDAVACEAAAQTVGAVMHRGDGADDRLAADPAALPGEDAGDGAAGGDVFLAFPDHTGASFAVLIWRMTGASPEEILGPIIADGCGVVNGKT